MISFGNFVSFAGIFILTGVAWLFSTDRRNMNWHAIGWGIGLQLLFGLFIFAVPAGSKLFVIANDLVVKLLGPATEGGKFVFGPLALSPGTPGSVGFILACQSLPTIIFFSALMSILYFYGIMPLLIRGFAWTFTRLMKVSGAESLCTAANIFVGVESAFTVRPHINEMTRSELCTVLTAGMATVASSVMALYVLFLRDRFPMIAGHLMSASVLSAPAAIVVSKVLLPENETPVTLGKSIHPHYEKESSVFEAIINASMAGAKMIVGIVALLIAVLGLVALLDLILGGIGGRFNAIAGIHVDWSFRNLLGYVFYPFTLICGVPLDDAMSISRIIGERLVVTEVTSYQDLAAAIAAGTVVHPRSIVIATYALCGFAHVASMAIFIGGFAVLAPQKMKLLSEVGFRALFAATLACLMTACVAGTFFSDSSMLLMGKP